MKSEKKSVEIEEKDNLEKHLEELDPLDEDLTNELEDVESDLPERMKLLKPFNLIKIKKECKSKASEYVKSTVDFYLNEEMINKIPYITRKIDNDVLRLSKLYLRLEISEHSSSKLLEEIDDGNVHPRQFEVMSALEKSEGETLKMLTATQIDMENSYKTIFHDWKDKQEMLAAAQDDDDVYSVGKGQRALLEGMKKKIEEAEEIEEVEETEEADYDLNDNDNTE